MFFFWHRFHCCRCVVVGVVYVIVVVNLVGVLVGVGGVIFLGAIIVLVIYFIIVFVVGVAVMSGIISDHQNPCFWRVDERETPE